MASNGAGKATTSSVRRCRRQAEDTVDDVARLFRAWTNASAEMWKGSVGVVADVIEGLGDPVSKSSTGDEMEHTEASDDDAEDRGRGPVGRVTRTLERALNTHTRVMRDSLDRFSETLSPSEEEEEDPEVEVTTTSAAKGKKSSGKS